MSKRLVCPIVRPRRGVTLVELIVALTIIALAAGIAGLTMESSVSPLSVSIAEATVIRARDSALALGAPVTCVVSDAGTTYLATAFPDGRIVSNVPNLDRLTGRFIHDTTP